MIKIGDKKVIGVLKGDTSICRIYKGDTIVYDKPVTPPDTSNEEEVPEEN